MEVQLYLYDFKGKTVGNGIVVEARLQYNTTTVEPYH